MEAAAAAAAPINIDQWLLSSARMLYMGLKFVNVPKDVQNRRRQPLNVRIFRSHYGLHPNHAASMWKDLLTSNNPDIKVQAGKDSDLKSFFMALHHLRLYLTDDVNNVVFGSMDFDKMRQQTYWFIQRIAALRAEKIVFPTEWKDVLTFSIDGTATTSRETRHEVFRVDPSIFSYKHQSAGHNIQVALSIWEPKIVDVFVSKGGVNDMGNLHASQLLQKLPVGKRAIVDAGYGDADSDSRKGGFKSKLSGYNQFDDKELKRFKERVKARHERINKFMKVYDCLSDKFRHNTDKFETYVFAVSVCVQYQITDTNPESVDILYDV